jgi:hypothetical protein
MHLRVYSQINLPLFICFHSDPDRRVHHSTTNQSARIITVLAEYIKFQNYGASKDEELPAKHSRQNNAAGYFKPKPDCLRRWRRHCGGGYYTHTHTHQY